MIFNTPGIAKTNILPPKSTATMETTTTTFRDEGLRIRDYGLGIKD